MPPTRCSGPLATPGVETKRMMAAAEGRLRQLESVVRSLAWASPIRLSGRGIEPPASRRRSRAIYHKDITAFDVSKITASGGTPNGQNGTVFIQQSAAP